LAAALRELHYREEPYGAFSAHDVLLRGGRAELEESTGHASGPASGDASGDASADFTGDVRSYGKILYRMLNGIDPGDLGLAAVVLSDSRIGPAGIRSEGSRLALQCLAPPPAPLPSMQRVVTQVRLLWLLARQATPATPAAQILPATPPMPKALPSIPKASSFLFTPGPEPAPSRLPVPRSPVDRLARTAPVYAPLRSDGPAYNLDHFGHIIPDEAVPLEPRGGTCPKCGSISVYLSRPKSGFERRLEKWDVPICRCHRCNHRYLVLANLKISKEMPPAEDGHLPKSSRPKPEADSGKS
jgi:hypothetical protein